MDLSTKGKDVRNIGGPGFDDDWPQIGHYQFIVSGIEVQPERAKNGIIVDLEVITGEVPGQEGHKPRLFLWYDPGHESWNDNAMDRIVRFFWACGLIEENETKQVDPQAAIGRCFVGKVAKAMRKKSKNDPTKIEVVQMEDGGYWRIGDDAIKNLFTPKKIETASPERKPEEKAADSELDDL